MIAVIDYDIGNLGSVSNMLQKIGVRNCITHGVSSVELATLLDPIIYANIIYLFVVCLNKAQPPRRNVS